MQTMFQKNREFISLFELFLKRKFNFQDRAFSQSFYLRKSANSSKELDPLEMKPFKENDEDVWIGPPNPESNLRLKVFPQSPNISEEERNFYLKSKEVQDWNQQYWATHNKDFNESRKLYIDKVSKEKNLSKEDSLTSEELSVFYKDFLDRNRLKHITYNWNWYRRNVGLIFLAAKVKLTKFRKIISNSVKLKF